MALLDFREMLYDFCFNIIVAVTSVSCEITLGSRAANTVTVVCLSATMPEALKQKLMVVNQASMLLVDFRGTGNRAYTTKTFPVDV